MIHRSLIIRRPLQSALRRFSPEDPVFYADYPLIKGREQMLEVEVDGNISHALTDRVHDPEISVFVDPSAGRIMVKDEDM